MDERGEDVMGIFYDKDRNEDGFIIYTMNALVTTNDLFMFRHDKEYMLVPHRSIKGAFCEIYYPEDDNDEIR